MRKKVRPSAQANWASKRLVRVSQIRTDLLLGMCIICMYIYIRMSIYIYNHVHIHATHTCTCRHPFNFDQYVPFHYCPDGEISMLGWLNSGQIRPLPGTGKAAPSLSWAPSDHNHNARTRGVEPTNLPMNCGFKVTTQTHYLTISNPWFPVLATRELTPTPINYNS